MKVGIIRCMQTEDYCPGAGDFAAIRNKKGGFADVDEEIEIVGFCNCGGCPGKKVVLRAREMVKRGCDTIAFASCISLGNPVGFPCPHADKLKEIVKKDLGDKVRYIESTH